jgi:hypothetical protein
MRILEKSTEIGNEFEIYINDSKKISSEDLEKSMDYKLSMENFSAGDYDPGKNIVEKAENKIGLFVDDEKRDDIVTVHQEVNPYQGISFGFIDCFARVLSESSFLSGTLILRYDPKKLGNVERDTLRLFEWNEDNKFFQIVEPSAVGREGHYVWGRITLPGVYAVIGLNSDPRIRMMLKIIAENKDQLKTLEPEVQKGFFYDICKVILGSDHELSKALKDRSVEGLS